MQKVYIFGGFNEVRLLCGSFNIVFNIRHNRRAANNSNNIDVNLDL